MKVKLYTGQTWSINPKLKQQLDGALQFCKYQEMDVVILVSGPEGWGKSFAMRGLGRYAATFMERTFTVDDIHFDLDVYKRKSALGEKFLINVLDEGRKALGRGKVRDKKVEGFLDYLSECRSRQQVHIIGVPAFHDLKEYVVKWRAQMIIKFDKFFVNDNSMPTGVKMRRGGFRVFTDKDDIAYCYEHKYIYPKKYLVQDWWSPVEVFTPEEVAAYNEKKDYYTRVKYVDDEEQKSIKQIKDDARDKIIFGMFEKGLMQKDIAEYLNLGTSTVSRVYQKFQKAKALAAAPINHTNDKEERDEVMLS